MLLARLTAAPAGAALVRVTVQLAVPPLSTVAGVQATDATCTGALRASVAARLCPLRVPVTVALWSVVTAAAVTEKMPLAAPAATDADAGIVRLVLSLLSAIVVATAAAFVRLTVQVAAAPALRVSGVHASEASCAGADTLSVEILETPLAEAVIVAV